MATPTFPINTAAVQTDLAYMINAKPLLMAYQSASPSVLTSTWTPLPFDTEVYDRTNIHSAGSPADINIGATLGWYRVIGRATIFSAIAPAGSLALLAFWMNNQQVLGSEGHIPNERAIGGLSAITPQVYIQSQAANDLLQLRFFQNTGSSYAVQGHIYVEFLGT